MKKQLWKDIWKSVTKSWGRFISIMMLMALGSFALVGLFVTGPDMRATGERYFDEYNVADLSVISSYGISETEREAIEQTSGVQSLEYIYLQDVLIEGTTTSVRVFSEPDEISLYELKEGRMPRANDEIALDYMLRDDYEIGETIEFTEKVTEGAEASLRRHEFKVVGFIYSSEILSTQNRGATTIGTGALDSYAVVKPEVFATDYYMMAKIVYEDTADLSPYTDEYDDKIAAHQEELSGLLGEDVQEKRLIALKATYQAEIDEANEQVVAAKGELDLTRAQLANAKIQIANANTEIAASENKLVAAASEIVNGEAEIAANEQLLNTKQAEYEAAAAKLAAGRTEYETKLAQYTEVRQAVEAVAKEIGLDLDNISVRCEELKAWLQEYAPEIAVICQDVDCDEVEELVKEGLAKLDVVGQELAAAKAEIEQGEAELATAKTQLDTGWAQLNAAKMELINGKNEYASGQIQLANAKQTLSTKTQEYYAAAAEFAATEPGALEQIAAAEAEIAKSQEKVDNLALPTYDVDTRREIPGSQGYTIYNLMPEIIDSLARVFPVFLYFVAALVTLTTMTRFVNEERINSGTLKSLGYDDKDIMKKFIVYGLIAGTVGTVIGIILGHTLLPMIAYNAYKVGFSTPELELHFYPTFTALAIVLSLCSSVLPAYLVAKRELKEKPAELMLPKAPKAGSKILLERMTPLWKRMSFTHKVTARNIFRYKSRMWMTIIGVAGAVAILFTGFSVKASIANINERQFGEIIKYDMIVAKNETATGEELAALDTELASDEIKSHLAAYYETAVAITDNSRDKEEVTVVVPEGENSDFADYIALYQRESGEKIDLNDDGVVISERLAELLEVTEGETFEFKDAEGARHTAKVAAIAEMYTGHFMFMNQKVYEQVYGDNATAKNYQANANLVLLENDSRENTDEKAAEFMELAAVKGLVSNTTLEGQVDTITSSLNMIMGVLIIIAAMLTVVIIYNLTNINVMERIRELSTIKVLGFRDREVTMYIYRETWLLTLIAIAVGWGLGLILHAYILAVVPPNDVMFDPRQVISSFVIPLAVVVVVTRLVQRFVHKKLIELDMLEALKSVD